MSNRSDEVFHLKGENLTPLPIRSMREGLLGKSLEDALQIFFEKYPQIIPGKQIDPGQHLLFIRPYHLLIDPHHFLNISPLRELFC